MYVGGGGGGGVLRGGLFKGYWIGTVNLLI